MERRNLWRRSETECMLKIFKEKKVIDLLDERKISPNEIWASVEVEMSRRGFGQKTAKQIQTKWRQLKSAYICAKRNLNREVPGKKTLKYYDAIEELIAPRTNILEEPETDLLANARMKILEMNTGNEEESESLNTEGNEPDPQAAYRKNFQRFMQQLKLMEIDLLEHFIAKQKELIRGDQILLTEREEMIINAFSSCTTTVLLASDNVLSDLLDLKNNDIPRAVEERRLYRKSSKCNSYRVFYCNHSLYTIPYNHTNINKYYIISQIRYRFLLVGIFTSPDSRPQNISFSRSKYTIKIPFS